VANIREYNAPDTTRLTPSDRAAYAAVHGAHVLGQAVSEGAQAIRNAGNALQKAYDKYQDNQAQSEIAHGVASLATLTNNLSNQWNETAKTVDPNDRSIFQGFQEKAVQPAMDDFVGAFSTDKGKQWAQMQTARVTQHFQERMSADMATRAGLAVNQNLNVLGSQTSEMVRKDPTSLDQALGMIDSAVGGIVQASPNLTAAQSSKVQTDLNQQLKEQAVKSAFQGMADSNPQAMAKLLDSGKYSQYIDGSTDQSLRRYADQQARAKAVEARAADADNRRQQAEASQDRMHQYLASFVDKSGRISIPPSADVAILRDNTLKPHDQENLLAQTNALRNRLQQESSNATVDNPDVYKGFADRSRKGEPINRSEIWQAVVDKQLTRDSANLLLGAVNAKASEVKEAARPTDNQAILDSYQNRALLSATDPNALSVQELAKAHMDGQITDRAFRDLKTVITATTRVSKPTDDPHTLEEFQQRAGLDAHSPGALNLPDIAKARAQGLITDKTYTRLAAVVNSSKNDPGIRLEEKQFGEFLAGMKPSITHSSPTTGRFPEQDQRYAQFQLDARELFDQGRAAGTPAKALLDPTSKDYIGNILPRYVIGAKQSMNTFIKDQTRGPSLMAPVPHQQPVSRLPGESAAEYLVRTGVK